MDDVSEPIDTIVVAGGSGTREALADERLVPWLVAAAPHALRDLQAWMPDHLDADLSVPALAARAHMSVRHFGWAFREETGRTPAVYVEQLRVERCRLLLESTPIPVERIAAQCGFVTAETMRRAFARRVGTSPAGSRPIRGCSASGPRPASRTCPPRTS